MRIASAVALMSAAAAMAFFIQPEDTVNPASPTGGDFYRGGCSHIELYRDRGETQVYASFFDYGVFADR